MLGKLKNIIKVSFIGRCILCKTVLDWLIVIEEVKAAQRQKLSTSVKPRTDYKWMELLWKTFHKITRNEMSHFEFSAGSVWRFPSLLSEFPPASSW